MDHSIPTTLTSVENAQDANIESTLHKLLTEANNHFDGDSMKLPYGNTKIHLSGNSDLESAIESAMMDMDSHDLLNNTILSDKQLSLETLLDTSSTADLFFSLNESDNEPNSKFGGNDNKRSYEDEDVEHDNSINKKLKSQSGVKYTVVDKLSNTKDDSEPFLSPASLSPSSSASDLNDSQIKLESIPLTQYHKKRTILKSNINNINTKEPDITALPEKFTNEFTMSQVANMKKRIISTHKLMLNFNFLKEGYARTCIELKKTMNCLKDSEIHRAHLLLENQNLKEKLASLAKDNIPSTDSSHQ